MQATIDSAASISCPLCQSEYAGEMFRSPNNYTILRCLNCSLVFTDDRMAPSADSLYPVFDQSGSAFAKGMGSVLKVFLRQRETFVRGLKTSGRVLDFGCGNGAFASQMSKAGFRHSRSRTIQPWSDGHIDATRFHLDPPRHLSHFESSALEDCLDRAGLAPVVRKHFLPEYGCSGWVQSSLNALLPVAARRAACTASVRVTPPAATFGQPRRSTSSALAIVGVSTRR